MCCFFLFECQLVRYALCRDGKVMDPLDLSQLQLYVGQLDLQLQCLGLVGCVIKHNLGLGGLCKADHRAKNRTDLQNLTHPHLKNFILLLCISLKRKLGPSHGFYCRSGADHMAFNTLGNCMSDGANVAPLTCLQSVR
jgi:hypothetical protein